MMESDILLFKKLLLISQLWPSSFSFSLVWFLNLFVVKVRIWNPPKVQQATIREFLSKSFVDQTVDNSAPLYTYSFNRMLFKICLTTAKLIKFTQNSDLSKSVFKLNFNLKPQWWRATFSCLKNSCRLL